MKSLNIIAISLATILVLQGCGSSSKKATPAPAPAPAPAPTPTPDPVPTPVHEIQPEDVAATIEKYKTQVTQVELVLDGVKYKVDSIDTDDDNKQIHASYEKGYLLIGFDFDENKPVKSLTILESTASSISDALQPGKGTTRLLGHTTLATTIVGTGDVITYTGTVTDAVTKEVLNVTLNFNESLIVGGGSKVSVSGTKATLNGTLGTKTYVQISDLINNNPEVDTLVLQQIDGSINDGINMHTGRLIRNAKLTTMVEASSDINSGGVDLYSAGEKRVYTEGAKVGVHSWCCTDGKTAKELGKDHEGHGAQLTYFREMLGAELGPEFYFFTIEAAPHTTVHVMTKAELDKYLITP